MLVYKIDRNSREKDIYSFQELYINSYSDLCIWEGNRIIDLDNYLRPSIDAKIFLGDIRFLLNNLEFIILYTYKENLITSIAFLQNESVDNCFIEIKYLCGNIKTTYEKINGKSQGLHLLNYIFETYKNYTIKIEPANSLLISYYTKFRKPIFPYTKKGLFETYNFLIYGDIFKIKEKCFDKLFRSINTINHMVNILYFNSIDELYENTHNLSSLKEKMITRLDHLVKNTKQIKPFYYEQLLDRIIDNINFYDIEDIIIFSKNNTEKENKVYSVSAGGKLKKKNNKSKKSRKSRKR